MVNFASEHMLSLAQGTHKRFCSSYTALRIRSFRWENRGMDEGREREGGKRGEREGGWGGGRSRLGDPS